MIIQIVLLVTALVFILFDALWGIRRGFFSALLRFAVVCACAVFAFLLSPSLADWLVHVPIPLVENQSAQELYEALLLAQEGVDEALSLSDPIRQLVYHLPEVLVCEFSFVILLTVFRLVTWPVTGLLSRLLFGKRKRKADGGKRQIRFFRSGGMLVGFAQALVCLTVFMVPFFGFLEFGERFDEAFRDSQNTDVAEMVVGLEENVLDPIHESPVTSVMGTFGMRSIGVWLFHELSTTTIEFSNGPKTIDYFAYLEDMFPAVSALLMMQDMDPEHMTDRDYENLTVVLQTAKSKEEITQAVKDTVETVVDQYVNEDYKNTADIMVGAFSDKLFEKEGQLTAEQIKREIEGIRTTLQVMETATSETAESAFEVVPADRVVDEILKTELLYLTIIETASDPEKSAKIVEDVAMSSDQKGIAKAQIEKYREASLENKTPEEMSKLLAVTDALADLLDIELTPFSQN